MVLYDAWVWGVHISFSNNLQSRFQETAVADISFKKREEKGQKQGIEGSCLCFLLLIAMLQL